MRGSGNAGGGTEEGGVPFGSGTLDTGWGAGRGGGFGSGSGGPGARGLGGPGRGGPGGGEGEGTGDGEKKIAGGGAAKAGQGLTPEQIRRVVLSRQGAFQACYELALSKDPSAKGGVTVAFSVSPGGSVASASVASSSLGNARVEGCMLRTFNRLKFPVADKATNAAFPFVFKGGANELRDARAAGTKPEVSSWAQARHHAKRAANMPYRTLPTQRFRGVSGPRSGVARPHRLRARRLGARRDGLR